MINNFYKLKILLLHISELENTEIKSDSVDILMRVYNQLIIESAKIYGTTN